MTSPGTTDDQIDWEVVRHLIDAEHANQHAMVQEANLKGRDMPPTATLATALDSWRQMPDWIQQRLAGDDEPSTVTQTLEVLIGRYGEDYPLP